MTSARGPWAHPADAAKSATESEAESAAKSATESEAESEAEADEAEADEAEADEAEADEAAADDEARPGRPGAVELAGAILIVSGVLGLIGTIGAASGLPAGAEVLFVVTTALSLGSVAIGLLARFGRAWLVAVNYVAVLGFLDLAGAAESGLALLLGVADVIVVVILFVNKPWFDAMRRWRSVRASRRRLPSPPVGGG